MRKYLKLIVLSILLVVLSTSYFVMKINVSPEARQNLYSARNGRITGIKVENPYAEIVFEKEDDKWAITYPDRYKADNSVVNILESILEDFAISRYVKVWDGTEDYGLQDPFMTISVKKKSGGIKEFIVGDLTVSKTQRFVKQVDDDHIYTMDVGYLNQFDGSLSRFRDPNIFDVDVNNLLNIEYSELGEKVVALEKKGKEWFMTYPYNSPIHEMALDQVMPKFRGLEAINFVDSDRIDMKNMGFEPPKYQFVITDNAGKQQTLLFGFGDSKGETFVMTEGTDDVAKVFSTDLLFEILEPTVLMDYAPIRTGVKNVAKVEVEHNGTLYEFDIEANKQPREYRYNGELLDINSFTSFYVKYMTLVADGHEVGQVSGQPDYSFKSTLNDGSVLQMQLYERDADTYYIKVPNEEVEFYLDKTRVEKMKDLLLKIT